MSARMTEIGRDGRLKQATNPAGTGGNQWTITGSMTGLAKN